MKASVFFDRNMKILSHFFFCFYNFFSFAMLCVFTRLLLYFLFLIIIILIFFISQPEFRPEIVFPIESLCQHTRNRNHEKPEKINNNNNREMYKRERKKNKKSREKILILSFPLFYIQL